MSCSALLRQYLPELKCEQEWGERSALQSCACKYACELAIAAAVLARSSQGLHMCARDGPALSRARGWRTYAAPSSSSIGGSPAASASLPSDPDIGAGKAVFCSPGRHFSTSIHFLPRMPIQVRSFRTGNRSGTPSAVWLQSVSQPGGSSGSGGCLASEHARITQMLHCCCNTCNIWRKPPGGRGGKPPCRGPCFSTRRRRVCANLTSAAARPARIGYPPTW